MINHDLRDKEYVKTMEPSLQSVIDVCRIALKEID